MDDKHFEAKDHANQVRGILQKAVQFCKEGKHLQAAQLLRKGLKIYPGQKEFLTLLGRLRGKINKQRIESLEKEALILIQSGDVDEAQIKFRQILEIDPTRTDLQHSIEKTSKESRDEINKQNFRIDMMRYSTYMVLIVAALLLVFFIWAGWENKKHINEAKQFIEKRQYEKAQQALQNCGWFMAKEKKHVRFELKKIADEKWEEALSFGDREEYERAIWVLKIASTASETPALFEEQIERFKERNRLKIEAEKAAQAAFEAALKAKRACEGAAQAARASNAETDAEELWREAEQLATSTDKLIEAKRFAEAQKVWNEAADKYEEAKATAKAVGEQRQTAILARDNCRKVSEIAKGSFAQTEASEVWQEAERTAAIAEKYFESKKFAEAQQAWLGAEEKYAKALDLAIQSPSYKEAMLEIEKWKDLKTGILERNVAKILGHPKQVHATSEECVWYYQRLPELVTNSKGEKKCIQPNFGFVYSTNEGSRILRERTEKTYNYKVKKEDSRYKTVVLRKEKKHEPKAKTFRRILQDVEDEIRQIKSGRKKKIYKGRLRELEGKRKDILKSLDAEDERYEKEVSKASSRHKNILSEIEQDYLRRTTNLVNGLTTVEPIYVVSEWKEPAQHDMISLASNRESQKEENAIQTAKWRVPASWRKLKLNMDEKDVHQIIGLPEETKSNNNQRIEFYGDVPEYGVVVFTERGGSSRGLSYWKEPLWSDVKGELSSESTTQEYITNKPKKPPK